MVNSMDKKRNILLIVEGAKTEVKLFERIIECFPEINLSPDNIIVYDTSLWVLHGRLIKEFGQKWYMSNDIDFRKYIESQYSKIKGKKITDTFLIFDYERHDPLFDGEALRNFSMFFNDSVENGQLYINYPMIESYKHLNISPLPDNSYKDRICPVPDSQKYKEIVGAESKYTDVKKLDRNILQQITVHNIKKISYILNSKYELSDKEVLDFCNTINYTKLVDKQNVCSYNLDGFIYVLCTCVLFISNYNKALLYDRSE